ncbi:MAG: SpoVA/SpoVAEb family sporulation membrane protein [Candidatus Borkfalkiaceae bacterium]|nr:SpoVA/SpoVAEb family sporulation membrane protein [Christensenellaceae bacterium]
MVEMLLTYLKAFAVGGAICTIAQLLINYTKITSGKILVYFMLAGLALQSVGLYQYLVDFAGAGATVPISGFGYLLANGAIKGAKNSLFGAFTGGLAAASAGVTAAINFGYFNALIFRAKTKRN